MTDGEPTRREKIDALRRVFERNPGLALAALLMSLFAALLEMIGLTFLLPIIEFALEGERAAESSEFVGYFVTAFEIVNLEPTLATLLLGLGLVMTVRYGSTFCSNWVQAILSGRYLGQLREQSYEALLGAEIAYVDQRDGDEIVNTIVTETQQSAYAITQLLRLVQTVLFIVGYAAVALFLSPAMTVLTVIVLGVVAFLSRVVLRSGYDIGEGIASANERVQGLVNSATRGLREMKLFNMTDDIAAEYREANDQLVETRVTLQRNEAGLNSFNQLLNVFVIFVLVYVAIAQLELSPAALGVFLFAMFRLSPQISQLNNMLYGLDGMLPHLVRTQTLIDEMRAHAEPSGHREAPDPTTEITLEDATFHYASDDGIEDVSLSVERGETIALVGPSGAGKSTIISLVARLYDPDEGRLYANGVPLEEVDLESWHDRVAIVRQHPFVFNDTLRYNVTVANPEATDEEIERAIEVSQVSAFLEDLPDGLETRLGDDGVRLSGGQRQRVAIARALLDDADVLLLDEATSELDSPTEDAIVRGIDELDREYATIVIGHWLSTVRGADRIYAVEDGRVVESGTHEELLAAGGAYADLYESQLESTATH